MIYLNEKPIHVTLFPDNTSQVWKLPEADVVCDKHTIVWNYHTESEVIQLFQLLDLLEKEAPNSKKDLHIKYLPYARQDKTISNSATFALNTFLRLLNQFNLHKIFVMDPHNFDAVRVRCQFEALYPRKELIATILETNSSVICYPDKGALKKYTSINEMPYVNFPFIYGEKVRDQATGNITSYQVMGNPKDHDVLIVDDICDGGMTFKILAKDLLAAGAKEVNLFVTHGIFSKGLKTLKESGINRVFTVDGEISETQNGLIYRRL